MTPNEFDYYLIQRDNKFMSPLLTNDDNVNPGGTRFLRKLERVSPETIVHLVFNPPIPKKPDMTDYLWLSGGKAVFSKNIYDVLKNIDIKDFQLVPAVIKDSKGDEHSDYWMAGVYREFAFLDEENSEFDGVTSDGCWNGIEKMAINREEMAKIPLEERLIYEGKESGVYVYYHKSIVDLIMSVNPSGIVFVPVEEWED